MASIDIATAQAHLQQWLAADLAVAGNQSYSISGRNLTRADAGMITEKIQYWRNEIAKLQRMQTGRHRTRYVVTR